MRLFLCIVVSIAGLTSACMNGGQPGKPGPGGMDPGTGSNQSPDLLIQSVDIGTPIPMPDGQQYAVPMQINLRNGGHGWIKAGESFEIAASLAVPPPDPANPNPLPTAMEFGASLVFDRPVTASFAGTSPATAFTGPAPRTFEVHGPINGKTNFTVSRTAYITVVEPGTYDFEVVVDWCTNWGSDLCAIVERSEGNNSKVVSITIP